MTNICSKIVGSLLSKNKKELGMVDYEIVTPKDFHAGDFSPDPMMSFTGTTIGVVGGVKGGPMWGDGGEVGGELPGRLFPYLGEVKWKEKGEEDGHVYCTKCGKMVIPATLNAKGVHHIFCPDCHFYFHRFKVSE